MSKPDTITLPVSIEELRDLLSDVEADWGFEYANAHGTSALVRLRKLIGGEPDRNMADAHERAGGS